MDLLNEMFKRNGTVSDRLKTVKQPEGGFLNPALMTLTVLGEGAEVLNRGEAINPDLAETAVYYLWMFMLGRPADRAFNTCVYAALLEDKDDIAFELISGIKKLDRESVVNAVNVCGFDVCYKAEVPYSEVDMMTPDDATIDNIIMMVKRALAFSDEQGIASIGPVGFDGGYSATVRNGFGDFVSVDTIWNFRTSWSMPDERDTLRVLMYWRLFMHSSCAEAEKQRIRFIGIFNPRRNEVYRIAVANIPDDLIVTLDRDVIEYRVL